MAIRTISPARAPFLGETEVPGDKSISHRAVMLGSLAEGRTRIRHFLTGEDCLSTIACFRQMGIDISVRGHTAGSGTASGSGTAAGPETAVEVIVEGRGLHGLRAAGGTLYAGNSGTTVRLMSGILAGQPFESCVDGDASVRRRPMGRIINPLSLMGADIGSLENNGCVPLRIRPAVLHGIEYASPVSSAQVKSCVLLAGLYADSPVSVTEPASSRDHTERMLRAFGADIRQSGRTAVLTPGRVLRGQDVTVPGDISSAAYFIASALIVPGSELLIKNVGINPTRDGILRVLKEMGADITVAGSRECGGELSADLLVRHSPLKGVRIEGPIIPSLIDELPVIAVLAAFAEGTTVIADAAELRVKESDRIAVMTENLQRMGVTVEAAADGMTIEGSAGRCRVKGARIDSHQDHRVAMSFAVAALAAEGDTVIEGAECVSISWPSFYEQIFHASQT